MNYCAQSQHPAEVLLTYSERTFAAVLFKTFAPFLPVTAEHVYIVTAAAATIDRLRPRANRRSADALPAATYPPLLAVAQVQCGFAADICRRRVNDRRQRSLSLSRVVRRTLVELMECTDEAIANSRSPADGLSYLGSAATFHHHHHKRMVYLGLYNGSDSLGVEP